MVNIVPFQGVYPFADIAHHVTACPYDILSGAQVIVDRNPQYSRGMTRSQLRLCWK